MTEKEFIINVRDARDLEIERLQSHVQLLLDEVNRLNAVVEKQGNIINELINAV